MITPAREEILLVLRGSFSEAFDESLGKWKGPFTPAKFQIMHSDNDFKLRISTDSVKHSDPLVFTSCRNISSVKKLTEVLLQVNQRGSSSSSPAVAFCIQFATPKDQNHFFLILKNAAEELKSREKARTPMAATPAALPLAGASGGSESPATGAEMESLIASLQRQIASGDSAGACESVANLAKKRTNLSMTVVEIGSLPGIRSKFQLEVHVEDIQSSGAKIKLSDVTPNMTIGYLKKLVFQQYNFPVEVQRWIVGRRIVRDGETLMGCRINSSTPVYLYLISGEKAGITRQEAEMSRQAMMAQQGQYVRPFPAPIPPRDLQSMPAPVVNPGPSFSGRSALREPGVHAAFSDLPPVREPPQPAGKPTADEVGWHCPRCTLINPPTVPGCRACLEDRPKTYLVPAVDSYIMDPEEKLKQDELLHNERLMKESRGGRQEPDQTSLSSLDEELHHQNEWTYNELESD